MIPKVQAPEQGLHLFYMRKRDGIMQIRLQNHARYGMIEAEIRHRDRVRKEFRGKLG